MLPMLLFIGRLWREIRSRRGCVCKSICFYWKRPRNTQAGSLPNRAAKLDTVPGGWYVDFSYHGDMFDISDVFIDDLYKWIMVKEVEINPNGVGMLNIYRNDYWKDSAVRMLVPIVKPV